MRIAKFLNSTSSWLLFLLLSAAAVRAEEPEPQVATGTIRGTVSLANNGGSLHKARVILPALNRATETDHDGSYEIQRVPPGTYDIVVHAHAVSDARQTVTVKAGESVTVDFVMSIAPVREQITVTASGKEETIFESFQATTSVDGTQLVQKSQPGLGDVLEGEPGVAKRAFGSGNTRPVLRGFDGDRVLILQDGITTGTLSSQSGDHGEQINALDQERIEIVRGPATLLYGSNAIGGVVNAVSGHFQTDEHALHGASGYVSAAGGTANAYGGGSASVDYGWDKWNIWMGGGGQRTGDYDSPIGDIVNSRARGANAGGGLGFSGKRGFFNAGYDFADNRYGIPFAVFLESGPPFDPDAEVVNLRLRKHNVLFQGGFHNLDSAITGVRAQIGYSDYRHGEYDDETLETDFFNKVFSYRLTFDQRKWGKLSGSFGLSGNHRDYETIGDEALAPPVVQNGFSLFTLQTLDFEKVSFQFGARFEHAGYSTSSSALFPVPPPNRDFNGLSAAAGIRVPLWKGAMFVANYTHSFRAPALEELYNNGAHPGNVAFEIGNPNLTREMGNGIDLSLRHSMDRVRLTANFFRYLFSDFVFLTPTGQIQDGLPEAEYLQGNTRYMGGEFVAEFGLHNNLWLSGGIDAVSAELTDSITSTVTSMVTPSGTPLPRIPPLRGRVGMDFRWKGLSVRPEGVFARDQDDNFPTETPTAGYALFNLAATYTIARQHFVHVFGVNAFNLNDELYRNHLSFIKDLAPEIGRGVRFSYTVRFF
jgi:iron complex outermembrane receptor protein